MTNFAITGHRPERFNDLGAVERALTKAYAELRATHIIQGMAAGVDLIAAKVAYRSGIPFTCAKPWKAHRGRMGGSQGYNKSWENDYEYALRLADRVIDVTDYEYYPGAWVYHTRNEWMVDNAEKVIAVWDGSNKGGTAACVKYAISQGKPIYRVNVFGGESGWLDRF